MRDDQLQTDLDRDGFMDGLPVAESESTYLSEPTGVYESRRILGRDSVLLWYRVPCNMVVHTIPQPDWFVMVMPLNFEQTLKFDGRVSERFDLYACSTANGYMTTGSGRNSIAIGVRKSCLSRICALLANGRPEEFALTDFVLPSSQVIAHRLHQTFVEAATQSAIPLPTVGHYAMSDAFENDFITTIARIIVNRWNGREIGSLKLPAISVIRRALEYSDAVKVPTLADLCAATGVSQRWLNKCFIEVLGLPPSRYLKLLRLTRARNALLTAETAPPLIKSLSLSIGYTSSGRFAADYRSVFGENPSDTFRNRLAA